MATSGTYAFDPSLADIVLDAFDRIQIRPAAITLDHMLSARRSLNQTFVIWSNQGINLWLIDQQSFTLVPGQNAYTIDASTVCVLETWVRNVATQIDTFMTPISRSDWAALADKNTAVTLPSTYWFNRTNPPVVYVWGTPNTSGYEIRYYRMRQLQDANPQGTETPDIPYRFEEALCSRLAAFLSMKWKNELFKDLDAYAKEQWGIAVGEDRERVVWNIAPQTSDYFR